MENTDGQGLFQQNPPLNLLNPMALSLPSPNSYAYYPPFQNPNPYPTQSWDSNSQIDVIHPPGVEPPTVPPISSACGTLQPFPSFTYLQNQAIASSSTPVDHYYHDPNVHLAVAPFATGITEPATDMDTFVATNITSSLSINQNVGPQNHDVKTKGPKKIKIVRPAWCEICKVDCNSKSILDQHKLGKKHKKNMRKLVVANGCIWTPIPTKSLADIPAPTTPILPPSALGTSVIVPNGNLDVVKSVSGPKAQKKAVANEDLETKKRKMLEGGVAAKDVRMCTICNVVCNSEMVFMHHLAGQKHATMMQKSTSTTGMVVTTLGWKS